MRLAWLLVFLVLLVGAAPAAAPPWRQPPATSLRIPLAWYQGVAADRGGNLYFAGLLPSLYRADSRAQLTDARDAVIPAAVRQRGYNHIGDIAWTAADGGRLLLPLECYPCARARPAPLLGVASASTLRWRYGIELSAPGLTKVTWIAAADGLIWTSAGADLLAFRAHRGARRLTPVLRIRGVLPGDEFTGGDIAHGILWIARDRGASRDLWRIDLATRRRRSVRTVRGHSESEGVAVARSGVLWQLQSGRAGLRAFFEGGVLLRMTG